jgi:hypothetical protein
MSQQSRITASVLNYWLSNRSMLWFLPSEIYCCCFTGKRLATSYHGKEGKNSASSWVNGQIYTEPRFTRHPRTAALVDDEQRRTDGLTNWVNGQFYWTTIHPTPTTSSTVKFGMRHNGSNLRSLTSATIWSIAKCVNWLRSNWQRNYTVRNRTDQRQITWTLQIAVSKWSSSLTATSYIPQVTSCSYWRSKLIRWKRSHD